MAHDANIQRAILCASKKHLWAPKVCVSLQPREGEATSVGRTGFSVCSHPPPLSLSDHKPMDAVHSSVSCPDASFPPTSQPQEPGPYMQASGNFYGHLHGDLFTESFHIFLLE